MRPRARAAPALTTLGAVLVAGCLAQAPPPAPGPAAGAGIDHDALDRLIGEPVRMDHDHRDASQHTGRVNLELVSWSALGVEPGVNGFANFVFWQGPGEDLAFVAVDGEATGGFVVVDVADPRAPRALGRYMVQGSNVQEVRVFPDGRHAVMNIQGLPRAAWLADLEGQRDCGVCLHLVNVEDRANPRLVNVLPVDTIGSHNMDLYALDGALHVFYVGQISGHPKQPLGNEVNIARFVEGPLGAHLVKVGSYRHAAAAVEPGLSFPHDVVVARHPFTGQHVAYVSHWDGGAITVDVGNPAAPRELHVLADPAPSDALAIHWFAPEPRPRGARLVAWSAPEIQGLETGTGVVRSYDATDPAAFRQLGTWELPGSAFIPGQFLMSPHITQPDLERGLMAVSHYHAGIWVLDITDPARPRALGYYFPHGDEAAPYDGPIWWKRPNFDPDGYLPNVYQARWKDGLLWATERGTGLYVLAYTGPVPGPVPDLP